MSGGAFDYAQHRIEEIADQIQESLAKHANGPKDEWFFEMRPETISELQNAVSALRKAYVYAQRVDWFFSGDDGEESFHARLAEDLAELCQKEKKA
jgi:hypothetical protein